jgi:predicted acetyltransferase
MSHDTQLIRPQVELADTHRELVRDFQQHEGELVPWVLALDSSNFGQYVKQLNDASLGIGLKPGFVEHSTYWLVDQRRVLVGVSNLRHRLTPQLERVGGHIGFGVRPSRRREGHASRLLALTLLEAHSLNIDRVLMTCDKDNIASAKVIIKNGGILDAEFTSDSGRITQRYWIELV